MQKSFVVFDYTYNNRKVKDIKRTKAKFPRGALRLPDFRMRPTHWKDKVNSAMGIKDINFEEHTVFSTNYCLKGTDEEEIRHIFSAELIAFLAQKKDWNMIVRHQELEIYYGPSFLPPSELGTFIKEVEHIAEMFSTD